MATRGPSWKASSMGQRPLGFVSLVPMRHARKGPCLRPASSPLERRAPADRPEGTQADHRLGSDIEGSRARPEVSTAQPDAYRPQLPAGVGSSRPPWEPVAVVPLTSGAGGTSSPPGAAGVISAGSEAMLVVDRAGMNARWPAP